MFKGKMVFCLSCNAVRGDNHIELLELKSSLDTLSRCTALRLTALKN